MTNENFMLFPDTVLCDIVDKQKTKYTYTNIIDIFFVPKYCQHNCVVHVH